MQKYNIINKNENEFDSDELINLNEIDENMENDEVKKEPSYENDFNARIKWFSEISNEDVKTVGGKGASLGEMFNHKFPVPPGFVITAQSFEYFIRESKLKEKIKSIIENTDMENTEQLNKFSKEIRSLIEHQELPSGLENEIIEAYKILSSEKNKHWITDPLNVLKNKELIFVSVRSSATTEDLADASFAGQQESFLNIKGVANLIEHVKKCFSSLYTPRAIYYRRKKGFKESEALLAVVIQKMIDSDKSGVVFSKDPIKQSDDVTIESVFGLGEGIVSGKIKPDYYLVSRELKIKEIKISNKKIAIIRTSGGENETVKLNEERAHSRVLTNAEILEIADYAIKLEKHYNKPQDIEFAIDQNEIFIIQSRPITTLNKKYEKKELKGNVILNGLAASPGIGVGIVRIIKIMDDLAKIKKGEILVTEMTNPDMVVSMQKSSAIITDEGGLTSHAAIISREMGIPAVVGTEKATRVLKDGMKITVDGFSGNVYEGEIAETTIVEIKKVVDTERVKLKVILDLPDFAERAANSGIDSVGLLRLEGIIASFGKHPLFYEKENKLEEYSKLLENGIYKIAKPFKSVWIRTSDIRTDEFSSLKGSPEKELNPMLGFHGIRFSLKYPEILRAELKAIKNVAYYCPEKKFGIMFPQIISIEEVREAKKYFNEFKLPNIEFGVMIETPAAVQIIDDISNEVNFISFGTNDLTQYTLAVDRGEDNVQYLYNDLHPSIFSQINKVIRVCRSKKIETSICGQAGSKNEMVEFLFRKGINSISVNADAAYEISLLIKNMEDEWKKIREEKIRQDFPSSNNLRNTNNINRNNFGNNNGNRNKWQFKKWKTRKFDGQSKWDKKAQIRVSDENNLLNKNKIQISAEIEPIDNLEKINGKIEEIQEKINNEKKKELEERKKFEDNIENIRIDEDNKDEIEQKINSNEVFEAEIGTKEFEAEIGSNKFKEIGVYNPDEDSKKDNKKYNYDFEND